MDPVTPSDLQTFLSLQTIDTARAQMLLCDALAQATAIVTVGTIADPTVGPTWDNLPVGAASVIRGAAGRAYLNPSGVTTETVGPYSATRPAPSGSLFSANEIAVLKRLAGQGGAFVVDPTPDDAGCELYPWDENFWQLDPDADGSLLLVEDGGMWE